MVDLTAAIEQFKQMTQSFQAVNNPQAAFGMVLQNNPYYPQAMELVEKAGGDPMKAYRELCAQMGVDPNFLRNLV